MAFTQAETTLMQNIEYFIESPTLLCYIKVNSLKKKNLNSLNYYPTISSQILKFNYFFVNYVTFETARMKLYFINYNGNTYLALILLFAEFKKVQSMN